MANIFTLQIKTLVLRCAESVLFPKWRILNKINYLLFSAVNVLSAIMKSPGLEGNSELHELENILPVASAIESVTTTLL